MNFVSFSSILPESMIVTNSKECNILLCVGEFDTKTVAKFLTTFEQIHVVQLTGRHRKTKLFPKKVQFHECLEDIPIFDGKVTIYSNLLFESEVENTRLIISLLRKIIFSFYVVIPEIIAGPITSVVNHRRTKEKKRLDFMGKSYLCMKYSGESRNSHTADTKNLKLETVGNECFWVPRSSFSRLDNFGYYPVVPKTDYRNLQKEFGFMNKLLRSFEEKTVNVLFYEEDVERCVLHMILTDKPKNINIYVYVRDTNLFSGRLLELMLKNSVQFVFDFELLPPSIDVVYHYFDSSAGSVYVAENKLFKLSPRYMFSNVEFLLFITGDYTRAKFHNNCFYIKNPEDVTLVVSVFPKLSYDSGMLNLKYDNLMKLLIMVKNGGPDFLKMLNHNVPQFDSYIIMDTGSTDGTLEIARKFAEKHPWGRVVEEEWVGFDVNRNILLDMAGEDCAFTVMLDDTYYMQGDLRLFLEAAGSDEKFDTFSITIINGFDKYSSNRVLRSTVGQRYIYPVHEIPGSKICTNLLIPESVCHIVDVGSEIMEKRTAERTTQDLNDLLKYWSSHRNVPRTIYYIAGTLFRLGKYRLAYKWYQRRVSSKWAGMEEEIYDSYYMMATIADELLGHPKEHVIELYQKAYEEDPERRPEVLCVIGAAYEKMGCGEALYFYLKEAFGVRRKMEISGSPVNNMRPEIYNNRLCQKMVALAYESGDYNTGFEVVSFYESVIVELKEFLSFWKSVFYLMRQFKGPMPEKRGNLKRILFIAPGGWKSWNGRTLAEEGLGGSETNIIKFAEEIAKKNGFLVTIFCNTPKTEKFNKVTYENIAECADLLSKNHYDKVYINRYPEYIPICAKAKIKDIYVVLHDLLRESYEVFLEMNSLKNIFVLTDWHKEYVVEKAPVLAEKVKTISYGVETPPYRVTKTPYSFIYSSFPNRGLLHLLEMFPEIRKRYPTAILNVFCDLEHSYSNQNFPEMMIEIKSLIKQEGVVNHGWVSQTVLQKHWAMTHVWLYPCIFRETFCRTALEAAVNNVFCITSDLAALKNTVLMNNGVRIVGDPSTKEWQNNALKVLFRVLDKPKLMNQFIRNNYKWACTKTYDKVIRYLDYE